MLKILSILLLLCGSWAQAADLAWNASVVDEQHAAPDGYRIHWGSEPGVYTGQVDVGNQLFYHIPDDYYGTFYFVASAYNEAGQSGFSNEVLFTRDQPQQHIGATGLRASRYQVEVNAMGECGASPDITLDANGPSGTQSFGSATTETYAGIIWTAPASKQICKMQFFITRVSGTITGYTYTAKIWTLSGNSLSSVITNGTSSGVSGQQSWGDDYTWVEFTFADNPSVSLGTTYAITIEQSTINAGAYCSLVYEPQEGTNTFGRWTSTLSPDTDYPKTNRNPMITLTYWVETGGGTSAVPVIMRSYRARRN